MELKVYFHIGLGKTGSSAIQGFLNHNRTVLFQKYNLLYPSLKPAFEVGNLFNHENFFIYNTNFEKPLINYFKSLFEYCHKKNCTTLVLSWENHSVQFANKIKFVCNHLSIKPTIIVYLRRQDSWLESAWKQWGHKNATYRSFDDYVENIDVNWLNVLNQWEEILPNAEFKIIPYEKSRLTDGLVSNFLKIFNLNPNLNGLESPDADYRNINVGFKKEVIEILEVSKRLNKGVHDNQLFRFLFNNLPEKYRKSPFELYGFFTLEKRIAFLKKHEESNNILAKKFLPENFGPLFSDPIETKSHNDEPINPKKLIPIFLEILKSQNNRINSLAEKIDNYKTLNSKTVFTQFQAKKIELLTINNRQKISPEILQNFVISNNISLIYYLADNFQGRLSLLLQIKTDYHANVKIYVSKDNNQNFIEKSSYKVKIYPKKVEYWIPLNENETGDRFRVDFNVDIGTLILKNIEIKSVQEF